MKAVHLLAPLALFVFSTTAAGQESGLVPIDDADRAAIIVAVKDSLKDPSSAEFRWLPHRAADGQYCGMVNAKNSFGGYIGFTPFSVMIFQLKNPPEVKAIMIGMGNGSSSSPQTRATAITCANKGLDVYLAR